MSIERKLIGTTDAATSSAVYVEDVFSTWLYNGTGASQTITNGIDLATKGGMVWTKSRLSNAGNILVDTVRGANSGLFSWLTSGAVDTTDDISFSTSGYTLNSPVSRGFDFNASGGSYASWTFAKQAKFFDIVTYTGDGTNNRQIAHSLGVTPGMVIVKCTSSAAAWPVWHRSLSGSNYNLYLNTTTLSAAQGDFSSNGSVSFSSTTFPVSNGGLANSSGQTYVAYLFADSNSGGFGPAGTDSVVACGSYTGNGSASGPTVTLGWEPQWLLVKGSSLAQDWFLVDNMRGMPVGTGDATLLPNSSAAEAAYNWVAPTATGFQINNAGSSFNGSGETYIYLAIRRGPMRTPTDATKVFAPVAYAGNSTGSTKQTLSTGFPPDLAILRAYRSFTQNVTVYDRLRGNARVSTNITNAESGATGSFISWSDNMQFVVGPDSETNPGYTDGNVISWMFRRAPGFFDVVCYTGTGSATTVAHNLGVAPEFVFYKCRSNASTFWMCYHKDLGANNTFPNYVALNEAAAKYNGVGSLFSSAPSSSVLNLGASGDVNGNGRTYVAYLFATCPGVSKVGSYTGNGSSQTIDCGFASGARFVLIRRTDAAGDWWVYDSARGIVAANDPALALNLTAAEVTSADAVDPQSSGFIVNQEATCNINVSGATYIYLSIA